METVHATLPSGGSYTDYYGSRAYNEETVAVVRLTRAKKVAEGNYYDEGGTYLQYLRVPRGVDSAVLSQALRHTMGGSSCTHAYDCCGCASRSIQTKMIAPRKMQVRTKIFFNY